MKQYKGILVILLLAALLTGCSEEQTMVLDLTDQDEGAVMYSAARASGGPETSVFLYTASGIIADSAEELDPGWIVHKLAEHLVIPDTVEVLSFTNEDNKLQVDFNQAFGDHILGLSSYSENLTVHCVINTFLDAYDAESMNFTVEGKTLTTDYHTYNYPQTYTKNYMD